MISSVALAFLAIFAVSRFFKFLSGLKAVGYVSGVRCALSPRSSYGLLFPTWLNKSIFTNPGSSFQWALKQAGNRTYQRYNIISVVPWLHGPATVYVSSLELMRQISGYADDFERVANIPAFFGEGIAVVQKEKWKKHRRVLNSAFSSSLYDLVWKESLRTFRDMVASEGWEEHNTTTIVGMHNLTSKFTLSIISSCAFDFPFPWSEASAVFEQGMTMHECFEIVANNIPLRCLAPRWAYSLPISLLHRMDTAFNGLSLFLRSQVTLRREKYNNEAVAPDDSLRINTIFNAIIKANVEGGKYAFNESEVLGNTFVMLFAGHETAARVFTATLVLLGLYQDEQEKAFQEISRVLPNRREPTIEDFGSFAHIRNCFYEAFRLYPPGISLIRRATRDTHLIVKDQVTGENVRDVVLKEGTMALVDIVGIHYNPQYFPDPEAFKPSRWEGDAFDNEAFVGFGHGPRACMGRKFALVEGICFLVMLLRDWEVEVDIGADETPDQWRKRVLDPGARVTSFLLSLEPLPIRLTRRGRN
ncbi:hypothetical protein BOTBODRAFT_641585 [Botryobasidium botryosum FD-172 SS1]|uniref:Cytochrome P450 n=1 Tax=Botryobasidium botryosum (strain FD-172 SS1) TaxID=930990 RepID=A0A067MRS7_BOTB1|nr:hypothetical protein BOTBODRAFT_641585 [Botryobasidium botryosum FD-172 SS1]